MEDLLTAPAESVSTTDYLANKRIVDRVNSCFKNADNWLSSSGLRTDWGDFHDLYRGIPDPKKYKWMSNKFIPIVFGIIETAIDSLKSMIFGSNPPFEVKPVKPEDEEQASIMQRLLAYQFEEANLESVFENFIRQLAIYGTGIIKVYWDRVETKKIEWEMQQAPIYNFMGMPATDPNTGLPAMQNLGEIPAEKSELSFNGPRVILCNLDDVFVDPMAINIQDSWVIHRTRRRLGQLRQLHYSNPEVYNAEVLNIRPEDGTNQRKSDDATDKSLGYAQYAEQDTSKTTDVEIELLEWWGKEYDEQRGIMVPMVYTIAAGKYLIRAQENPFWHGKNPFVKANFIPQLNELYGIGISEIAYDPQININECFNQRNDNLSLALNPMIFYKKNSGIDINRLRSMPGGITGTEEDVGNSLQVERIPDLTQNTVPHISMLQAWIESATGVPRIVQGVGGGTDTATEAAIQRQAAGARLAQVARRIEDEAFVEILKMFYQLNYQFLDQEQVIRVAGELGAKWIKISPDTVRRSYQFVPTGSFTTENRAQKSLRLLQFYNIARTDPRFKSEECLKMIYRAMEIGDDPTMLLKSDEEMQAEMLGQLQAMQQNGLQGIPPGAMGAAGPTLPGMGGGSNSQAGTGVPPVNPGIAPGDRI